MDAQRHITADCPLANGRAPQYGEKLYTLYFPLDDGTRLEVCVGQPGMDALKTFIADMRLDDFIDSVLGSD